MSMRIWSEYGYGFPLFDNDNYMQVIQFILQNGNTQYSRSEISNLREIVKEKDEFLLEDFFDEPVSWVVASIINDLEGTTVFCGFRACADTYQEEYLGIEPKYPWALNSNDLKFTSLYDAKQLLEKYAKTLGVKTEPNHFEAGYCG